MEMNRKYILTSEAMVYEGRILYRIKAIRDFNDVKTGDLGGWVQSEDNLSHEGNCWIYDEAIAMDNSRVDDNARMFDEAELHDNAIIRDNVEMYDNSKMFNYTAAFDNAAMFDNTIMTDKAVMFDNARMYDKARMSDNSSMHDNSTMRDGTRLSGNAKLYYEGTLCNAAELGDNDELCGKLYCKVDNFVEIFVSKSRLVTGVLVNGEILYNIDREKEMTKEEFIERTKGDKEYLKIINMVEMYLS